MNRSPITVRRPPVTEPLERRTLLAIDVTAAQTALDADPNLIVQSAAGASDGARSTVVVYSDRDADSGLGNDVFLRRFGPSNVPLGAATLANVTTADAQLNPDVAADATGRFVVVWQSRSQDGSGWGVIARTFDAGGTPTGAETIVNQTTAGNQVTPHVAIAGDGRFVVTWVNADTGNGEVYARRFGADGTAAGNEFKVSGATTDGYAAADVAVLPGGGSAIAWTRTLRGGDNSADVQMRVYDAAGASVGGTFVVNATAAGDQAEPALAVAGGRFVVAWSDNSAGDATIFARAYDAAGSAVTGPIQVSQDNLGGRNRPKVAGDADGNFTVGWTRQEPGALYSTNDFRSYDSTFAATSNESSVGDGTSARTLFDVVQTGMGTFRDVATIGEFVGYGVPVSTSMRNVIGIDGTAGADAVTVADAGPTVVRVTVNGRRQDYVRNAFAGILATLGDGADAFDGAATTSNVTLAAGAGDDVLSMGGGDDSVDAGAGNDVVRSGGGADTLLGGAGDDSLAGDAGNDNLAGGDGNDTIDGGDGNDYAIGDAGNDSMRGGAGDDVLTSGSGKNTLAGGDGADRLNGSNGRETLKGEDGSDRLYGNGGNDYLDGGGGTDRIWAGAGDDFLVGGSGIDRLYGMAGNDTLAGNKGNDVLDGGDDTDTALARERGDTLISIERF